MCGRTVRIGPARTVTAENAGIEMEVSKMVEAERRKDREGAVGFQLTERIAMSRIK